MATTVQRQSPTPNEIVKMYEEDEVQPYYVNGPNSACVTMTSAISLLCSYCQTLQSDLYSLQQPKWYISKGPIGGTKIYIELPTVSPLIDPIEVCN